MWPNPQFSADLVTFPEEILNEKLDFLCAVISCIRIFKLLKNHLKNGFKDELKFYYC